MDKVKGKVRSLSYIGGRYHVLLHEHRTGFAIFILSDIETMKNHAIEFESDWNSSSSNVVVIPAYQRH